MAANDIARVYASSLVEFGQEKKILPEIEEEITFLAGLLTENSELRNFFASPGITKEAKKNFIEKVFKGRLSDQITNFLKVLIDHDRQNSIIDINEALGAIVDEVNNRQRVTVITSVGLDSAMKNKLAARLKEVFKKEIILNEEVNTGILGGIIIKVGDTVIDGSLVKDLKNIKNNLLNSKVRSEAAYED
ncbi:MAG: ATP synthase F1 subunit delta [Spirochaetes bacterium]|nr:ATP synthase F1 subunit delta [Spirochaetota bacterium]